MTYATTDTEHNCILHHMYQEALLSYLAIDKLRWGPV